MVRNTCNILLLFFFVTTASGQSLLIDSLKRIVELQRHDTTELLAIMNLTNEFLRKDISQAKRYSLELIAQADAPSEIKWLASGYGYLATIYQQTGRLDSALLALQRVSTLVAQNPGNVKMKYNYNQTSGLFYKNQGEYKKALPYMLDNLRIWTKKDETKAGLFLNLGNLYFYMGDFKNAASYHIQGLRMFEEFRNLRGQSFCLQSLGNDFLSMSQFVTAKKYFELSLQLKKHLHDNRGVLTTTISLGDVYKGMNDYSKSETYYKNALTAAQNLKLPGEEAHALYQSGLLYRQMKENKKARESFSKSVAIYRQSGDSVTIVKARSELMDIDLAEQNNKTTESQMLNGLNMLMRTGNRQQEVIEYYRLSEYYALNKNFEKSLFYLKKHDALADTVEGNTVLLQLKNLEEQYKSEKREREITLLKKDQELQKLALSRERANTTIIIIALISVVIISVLLVNRYRVTNRTNRFMEMERMRNTISRDLHDDIGSTLSSINIMSQLALREPANRESQLRKIATYSAGMMETMSDMVWSINPRNDSMEQMIVKMREFAAEILEPKNIVYDFKHNESINDVKLDAEKRKNLFLIFKEAINNTAKYSEASHLLIDINRENGTLHMQLRDNGKGFNATRSQQGNGLKNMAERAHDIKGTLVKESEPGKGTSIVVSVPIT